MKDKSRDQHGSNSVTSRRDVLRHGASLTAAVAVGAHGSRMVHAETPSADPNRTINIGIVGAGGRGTGAVNDSLTINENVRLVAIADLDQANAERLRKGMQTRHGEKVDVKDDRIHTGLDGYKAILDAPDIDVVYLTTSPGFRPSHIAEAVSAGKHVFAEKPSCVDPAGYRVCTAAHDQAVKNGTAIVTGTQYRRQINYVEAVRNIHDGMIGDIIGATTRYCSGGIWYKNRAEGVSDTQYQLNNWMHFIWLSGDQITEQAVHNIDLMNWVMGAPPESAYGSGGRFTRPEDSEMWDSMSIDYMYPGDRPVSFMCRQIPGSKGDNGSTIRGTKGTAIIGSGSSGSQILDRDGKEIWKLGGSIADAYRQEHKDLMDSIRAGKPIVELRETANSSLTAVLGRMAAYTGQKVTWDFATKESTLDLFPESIDWDGERPAPAYAIPGKTKLA
ncbi:Inositol 2-dehydrogenase/D-chiro-inositol 3-dehydrogenase [Rubripirellula lacrimiformis]|uniref:Inositol 2-dehydrogenase/D-chiro-inositol 3-dehydrogenase n=1 Tax=Rubripirellula lacrimiformis TaxID=1930273 RepID=A0A517NEU2_9BACT|nr:Gfo/Idh/MocA family oxidoreductase [Rubripirellula lacrimiformis]QDT05647.1 Inositol 2-dehydrogenase/D-chiro-inositol 3-dehydrogenase [Rubripirellula lacrimiformis]